MVMKHYLTREAMGTPEPMRRLSRVRTQTEFRSLSISRWKMILRAKVPDGSPDRIVLVKIVGGNIRPHSRLDNNGAAPKSQAAKEAIQITTLTLLPFGRSVYKSPRNRLPDLRYGTFLHIAMTKRQNSNCQQTSTAISLTCIKRLRTNSTEIEQA